MILLSRRITPGGILTVCDCKLKRLNHVYGTLLGWWDWGRVSSKGVLLPPFWWAIVTFVRLYCRPEHKIGTRSRENWPAVINRNIIRDINNSDLSFVVKCRESHGSSILSSWPHLPCKKRIKKFTRRAVEFGNCYKAKLWLQYMPNGKTLMNCSSNYTYVNKVSVLLVVRAFWLVT